MPSRLSALGLISPRFTHLCLCIILPRLADIDVTQAKHYSHRRPCKRRAFDIFDVDSLLHRCHISGLRNIRLLLRSLAEMSYRRVGACEACCDWETSSFRTNFKELSTNAEKGCPSCSILCDGICLLLTDEEAPKDESLCVYQDWTSGADTGVRLAKMVATAEEYVQLPDLNFFTLKGSSTSYVLR